MKLVFRFLLLIALLSGTTSILASDEGLITGIDVSHHQGWIDWKALTTNHSSVNFAFIKATEGITVKDSRYTYNYNNARKHGLVTGSYHFFSYRSPGRDQARHFLQVAKYKKGDLPLVLDVEYRRRMPGKSLVTREVLSFLKEIKLRTGSYPIIYCQTHYYNKYLKGNIKEDHHLWICNYKNEPDEKWLFWQKTDRQIFSGINGRVDYNVFKGSKMDFASLQKK